MRNNTLLRPRILGYRKDGRPIYSIAGASPDDPANDPAPTPDPVTDPPAPTPDPGKTFTQADVERIVTGRLTKFADYDTVKKQLGEIQAANATDSEKAIRAATEEGRKAGVAESAPRLVAAEFRAAAVGRFTPEQLAELTEDLDLSKYLTDSGEVDTARITKKIDALAPAAASKTAPSFGGGTRKPGDQPDPSPGLARMRDAYAENTKK